SSSDRVRYAREHLDAFVIDGSGTSYARLKEARVQNADVFAALTSNDEINLIACRLAKKLGVGTTIARIRNEEFMSSDSVLSREELGTDFLIQPEREAAGAIVRLIRQSNATDIIEFDKGRIQFIGIRLDRNCPVLHTPLIELGKRYENPPLRVVALSRRGFTIIPRGEDELRHGDQIFIITDPGYIDEALNFFGKTRKIIENILITGGGQIGRFVAQRLEKELKIKIIEINDDKSAALADFLSKSLIIHGDGSDLDLLTFEGLQDMDGFIAVTGDDETNIITSLVARHMKVPRTITLIGKNEYLALTPAIGMDAVVSKQQITVNTIQKYIRSQQIAFFAELPGIDAEIIEFIAKEGMKIIKKPLKDIEFPEYAIVGAVLKQDKNLEIPTGDTRIAPGDKVVVFTLPKALKAVEKLF
ncbi:MAG: Trk system potassium transporter TrkA, partial [Candidatus Kapaibacterium sp.]